MRGAAEELRLQWGPDELEEHSVAFIALEIGLNKLYGRLRHVVADKVACRTDWHPLVPELVSLRTVEDDGSRQSL